MTDIISVVIADDTLIAREGWKKILETTNDIRVVGEAKTASETLKRVKELTPDVLLMDLKWFGDETAGWTTIREIKEEYQGVKIIAVTAFDAEKMLKGVSGVHGTFGASRESSGPLPTACPMARSIRMRPWRRTQSWMAGWMPLR